MAILTRAEILSLLASRTGVDDSVIEQLFDSLATLAGEESRNGFLLPNFGKFSIQPGPEVEYRNPATGTMMMIPGQPNVVFEPDFNFEKQMFAEPASELKSDTPRTSSRVLPTVHLTPSAEDLRSAGIETDRGSQNKLGGMPDWIQDEPKSIACCGRNMTFYAQFDSGIGGEFNIADCGMIYVFVCDTCWKATSIVQYY